MTVLQCVPVSDYWDVTFEGDCNLSFFILCMASSIPHFIIDVVLLGFPAPLIWRLHMARSQKIMLTVIFAMGSLYVAIFFISTSQLHVQP